MTSQIIAKSVTSVSKAIENSEVSNPLSDSLKQAEALADLFADIKPTPFHVPIERFAGMASGRFDDDIPVETGNLRSRLIFDYIPPLEFKKPL